MNVIYFGAIHRNGLIYILMQMEAKKWQNVI